MPVAAAVEGNAPVAAVIALLDMPAERGGPAQFDRRHDAALGRRQRRIMLCAIGFAVAAEDIRHFRPRAGHCRRSEVLRRGGRRHGGRRTRQELEGTRCGADFVGGDPQVMGGGRKAPVTEQQLNGAHVGTGLQQMDGGGVPTMS